MITFLKGQYSTILFGLWQRLCFLSGVLRSQVWEIFITFQIIWIVYQFTKNEASCLLSSIDTSSPFAPSSAPCPPAIHIKEERAIHGGWNLNLVLHVVTWSNILGKMLFVFTYHLLVVLLKRGWFWKKVWDTLLNEKSMLQIYTRRCVIMCEHVLIFKNSTHMTAFINARGKACTVGSHGWSWLVGTNW